MGYTSFSSDLISFAAEQYTTQAAYINYVSGSVSPYVGRYSVGTSWVVTEVNETPITPISIGSITFQYYVVYASPTTPFGGYPWEDGPLDDVLEYACEWAWGYNNEASIVGKIAEGVYNDANNVYDPDPRYFEAGAFEILKFMTGESPFWCNCEDVSAAVQLFSNAVGIDITSRMIDGEGDMDTKAIKAIGKTTWNGYNFGYHYVNVLSTDTTRAYDACLKLYDTDTLNPPPYTGERVPKNELINSTYKDDFYLSGTYNPSTLRHIYSVSYDE